MRVYRVLEVVRHESEGYFLIGKVMGCVRIVTFMTFMRGKEMLCFMRLGSEKWEMGNGEWGIYMG